MVKYYDDGVLVKRVIDGETDLFGELINRHQGLVYGLAYGKVSNFTDAQDIAQDVFIKAFRKLDQLDNPENFIAWLKMITANECKNWLRQKKLTIPLDDAELQASYASLVRVDKRDQELRAEVLQSVEALSETYRTVITLHHLSGLSYEEISEFLDIPVAAVVSRMHRARKQLKADLMARVESAMTSRRLPDTFAQEVLPRLTLCPIDPGRTYGTKSDDEGVLVIGVPGGQSHMLLLAMTREGMEAIENCHTGNPDTSLKIRELISVKDAMDASRIKIKEVVLYLDKKSSCYARVMVTQRKTEKTIDLKVSDALFLAFRMGIPVVAESSLVSKGIAGTDGGDYEVLRNLRDFRSDLPSLSQRGRLESTAFDAAPLSIRGSHSVRCSVDFASDTIHFSVLGTDITAELNLNDHMQGLGLLCNTASTKRGYSVIEDNDGNFYDITYNIGDGEFVISFNQHTGPLNW